MTIIKNIKDLVRTNKYFEVSAYLFQNLFAKYFNLSGDTLLKDIDTKINYSMRVFKEYERLCSLSNIKMKDKSIFEIGTGNNFLIALQFLSKGAKKVVNLDRFNCLDENKFNQKLYFKFWNSLDKDEKETLLKKIIIRNKQIHIKEQYFQYITGYSLEDINKISLDKFDLIISNAVLEHTSDLNKCFKNMKKLSKKNGKLTHIVDLKNHNRFDKIHPLYFLTFSDWFWNLMSSNLGSPNRERFNKYESLFKKYNLKVLRILKRNFEHNNSFFYSIRSKLNKRFKNLDDETLKINGFKVVLKNETNKNTPHNN